MGICGRVHISTEVAPSVERTLTALSIGSSRQHRQWTGAGVRLARCDDGALATGRQALCAVFDGRIDNLPDLKRQLAGPDLPDADPAAIVLLAYDRWGDGFCDQIVGDYACAVWDGPRRRLVMAVDPTGARPLFYWLGGDEILFASEPRGLLADSEVPRALDEQRMARWLSHLPADPQSSLYKDIRAVPPGHSVIWDGGATRLERWWRPENLPALRFTDSRDYEAALLAALEQAVACRIDTDERVGAHLSGGLDSSAVTAIAARQLAAQGRRLTAFTAAPDHAFSPRRGVFGDEWGHAAAMAALYPNIDHVRASNNDSGLLEAVEYRQSGLDCPVLNPSNAVWMNAIDRQARDRGVKVMLTGLMGNMTISYDGGELLAARLLKGDLPGAARTALANRRGGQGWLGVLGEVADTVLPIPVRRRLRAALNHGEPALSDFSAVNPALLEEVGLDEAALSMGGNLRNLARGDSRALRLAVFGRTGARGLWAAATRRLYGVDTRDPTSDRRLVELCLTIPDEQFRLDGMPRSLIRRTMAGLVPDVILTERRKGRQAADWWTGFDAARGQIASEVSRLANSTTASRAIDMDRLQTLIDNWPEAGAASEQVEKSYKLALSRALGAGLFIRRVEGGNA
ncbi:MAG: asparagine synthase-related protein [Caulobacter sp.]|nr:asparagine synthase-related protein [Caulobacter sp.]